ncbi:sialin [Nilaparvata lugens]|uniref:sialin n=1 Tax=Nilaparvata lugens TaxID=108931 RepID=UPI00193D9803|nr:sialin [Nilaparvata lugens]
MKEVIIEMRPLKPDAGEDSMETDPCLRNENVGSVFDETKVKKKGGGFGTRHLQVLMISLIVINVFATRVNLSVGIVAMTDNTSNPKFPDLNWDTRTKGFVLSSFFWGYLLTQIPAGHLAGKYGPKFIVGGAVLTCGVLTLLTPLVATRVGWKALCVLRFLEGLWTQLGTVVTLCGAGLLADSIGWPSIFYVTGAAAVSCALLWLKAGSDSPAEHSSISAQEKHYIESSLVHSSSSSKSMRVPWKAIATSGPVWALLITHLAQNWGFWTLLTLMPTYINSVLGFNIKSNGSLSALPYLGNFILTLSFSWLADILYKKGIMSISTGRKMWNSIGLWGASSALLALGLFDHSVTSAVTLLILAVALNSGTFIGFLVNHVDLAPNFAGVLMGITNGFSNVASILGPIIAGIILTDETNAEEWKLIFYLSSGIYFFGNLVFVIFGTAQVQTWNDPESESTK